MTPLLFTLFLGIWIAFLGGAVGSFLNVVVYRLPAGMSLVHPPSRCPRCEHAIRWHDNLPVLGWLGLRGKCRDCGLPISPRYPIVEALTACMFLLVAWADGIFGLGVGFVATARNQFAGEMTVIAQYLLHVVLLSTLWTAALMQYDRQLPPARMLLLMGTVLGLGSVGLELLTEDRTIQPLLLAPCHVILSGLAAGGMAMLATFFWTYPDADRSERRWPFVELAFLGGLVIPAVSMIDVITWAVLSGLVISAFRRAGHCSLLCLMIGLVIYLVLGQYYQRLFYAPVAVYGSWINLVWLSLLLVLLTEACVVIRNREEVGRDKR